MLLCLGHMTDIEVKNQNEETLTIQKKKLVKVGKHDTSVALMAMVLRYWSHKKVGFKSAYKSLSSKCGKQIKKIGIFRTVLKHLHKGESGRSTVLTALHKTIASCSIFPKSMRRGGSSKHKGGKKKHSKKAKRRHSRKSGKKHKRHGKKHAKKHKRHGKKHAKKHKRHGKKHAKKHKRHGKKHAKKHKRHGKKHAKKHKRHGKKHGKKHSKKHKKRHGKKAWKKTLQET